MRGVALFAVALAVALGASIAWHSITGHEAAIGLVSAVALIALTRALAPVLRARSDEDDR